MTARTGGLDALVASLMRPEPRPPRDTSHWIGPAHLRPPLHAVTQHCPRGCWWCVDYGRDLYDLMQVEHEGSGRRFCNALLRAGVRKVADLKRYPDYRKNGEIVDGLNDVPMLGTLGIAYIRRRLRERG